MTSGIHAHFFKDNECVVCHLRPAADNYLPNTYVDENDNWQRLRCIPHGKIPLTEDQARRSATRIRENKKFPTDDDMQAYKANCGYWHVSTRERNRKKNSKGINSVS